MAKIDRDAAIAVLFHRYEHAAQRYKDTGEAWEYGAMVELDRAGLELSRLPAEEDRPGVRWVRLSEALPEEKKAVLVWVPLRKNIYMAYYEPPRGWMVWNPGSVCIEFPASAGEIVAWAPLPEPYKEEEQDEQGAG